VGIPNVATESPWALLIRQGNRHLGAMGVDLAFKPKSICAVKRNNLRAKNGQFSRAT